MKVITLTQPWATLVAIGAKRIETRSWSTRYRGPLAIHAAKGPGGLGSFKAMRDLCGTQPFFDALMPIVPNYNEYCDRDAIFERLISGAIIAVCQLKDCRIIGREANGDATIAADDMISFVPIFGTEWEFGDYVPGRYAWLLANVRALPDPIPAKGALGLWDYEGRL